MNDDDNKKMVINVSGAIFETFDRTLRRFPTTLLGNEHNRQSYYCPKTGQYFFNRNRQSFEAILFYYQSSGHLACPSTVRVKHFEEDCKFFRIPEDDVTAMKRKQGSIFKRKPVDPNLFRSDRCCSAIQKKVWLILEYPSTSVYALCFSIISFSMILVSLTATCLETVPQLKVHTPNITDDPWYITELLVSSWFLFELVARFICSPDKLVFLQRSLVWIDIVAVIPYFTVFAVDYRNVRSFPFLRVIRLWRVLRLFRIANHSNRMRVVNTILKESVRDLEFFVLCLTIIIVFSASVVYFLEADVVGSGFKSIPESCWWTVQTLLTIGYGDITPVTVTGKLFSCVVMVIGAVIMSLPVLAIIISFSVHLSQLRMEEEDEKEEEMKKSQAPIEM